MAEPVNVGLVSTSWWADAMHVPAIKSHDSARLVACCGRDRDRARDFTNKHEIPTAYTDFREMIAKEDLDLLVIATPETAHHEICLAAAEQKIHVVCEKPLSLNASFAKEMVEAAQSAGIKHMTYFTWRWIPWLKYAKALVAAGSLGQIYEISIRFAGGYGRSGDAHWKWNTESGTGILGDLGSHAIDLGHWLVGPIAEVDSRLASVVDRPTMGAHADRACDAARLLVGFDTGTLGTIEVSAVAHLGSRGMEWRVEMFGEKGSLRVDADFSRGWRCWVALGDEEGSEVVPPDEYFEGVDREADFFTQSDQVFTRQSAGDRLMIDSILNDLRVEPTLEDGYRAQLVMDAAIEASRCGTRVRVGKD
ncbi:MAG: Gfo/Idh/MocA family oxidoreductase [Gemmatimonadetes bacterium]|nr:Gfo/Idh/MocA family oxidoreductase [Gemmatimonadota bacterium]